MADGIILTFDFETAPPAGDLGDVFAALARDYREISNGGTLVVSHVESGSIIVTVTDAVLAAAPYVAMAVGGTVSTMAAINTVAKFAENLKTWFGRAKTEEGKKRLYKKGKKSPGQRSVEAIVRTAAKTRSRVKVKHTKSNGETLEAELTPTDAIEIREATIANEMRAVEVEAGIPRALTARPEVRVAIESLRQAGSQNLSQTQIQTVVDIIVSVLQSSGAGHALPEIASHLEIHGLYDFALAVRQHIRGSSGTNEPPLTTT
jgi:hypothetical protein